ncbi:MAG TPA: hypothetical protein VJR89_20755 [Polyangiales bacterium]|nr:hypothetical protein [Polyangiales bacterium]
MLARTLPVLLLACAAVSCGDQPPDYVVEKPPPPPPACDTRSRLVRIGFPENLEELFIGSCTVVHTETMRGPDLSAWLNASPPWTTCDGPVSIPFWVERDAMGKISRVHFCPDACADLLERLKRDLKNDLVCEPDAGMAGQGAVAGAGGAAAITAPPPMP